MADRLELEARFNDHASAGVKRLGKTLETVRPSNGMQAAQKWMGDFRGAAEKANVAVRPITGTLTALGVGGLAASMSMSELVKQIKGLSDSTLNMRELSRQSRISMGDLQRLQYVATKFHMDPAAVDGVLAGWSDKMLDLKKHTGDFYNELMRQNQDVAAKIQADSPVEALKDTLEFLSRIKDPALQRRWADSMNLGALVPMLGKGQQGLAEAFAEAGREVKPITQAMVEAADKLNASTARMTQSWTNLKNDIGPSVIEPLSHVIDRLDATLKLAAANPGDAAAVAGVGALTAGALYARRRIMRGSKIAGGGAEGAELVGAAREQVKAGSTLLEAAIALKEAAADLRGRGGLPGGASAEGGKPGGSSPGYASLTFGGFLAALNLKSLADGMPDQLERAKTDNAPIDSEVGREADWGDRLRKFFRGSSSDMHPDEDRLSRARPGDLKRDIQEGSKAGIVAGLREMAQQQELGGGGGDGGPGGTLGAAARVLGKAGVAAGGRPRAGGGFTRASGGGTTRAGGSLAANQKEAYAAAKEAGLSPLAAHALVANMSGEGLANDAHRVHWDGTHDSGGIVQWDPQRAAAIKAHFGKLPWEMSVGDQTKAAIWEIQNNPRFSATAKALNGDNAADMIGALVDNYEVPKYKAKAKAERMGYYRGFNPDAQQTPGAGTPGPSSAAVTDAEVFAARQRIIAGGHDPKDIALRDRYLKEQNTPKGHRAGGWINGPGTGTSDSVPARLSHGEYVVNARASGQWGPLLEAINEHRLPAFRDGGPVGFGVGRQFYPKFTPAISAAEGHDNRRMWREFFRRPTSAGGMGASWRTTLGTMAMLAGESGFGLNSKTYGWDVNGPSGGVEQWHDVTQGRWAGKIHRLSDLMTFAMRQHADWHDPLIQQAFKKHEDTTSFASPWRKMLAAKTARGVLKEGIDHVEIPANKGLELLRRMPNIAKLQREAMTDGAMGGRQEMDPLEVNIRHHPHTGHPIVTARSGRGVKLGIRTAPMMRPT